MTYRIVSPLLAVLHSLMLATFSVASSTILLDHLVPFIGLDDAAIAHAENLLAGVADNGSPQLSLPERDDPVTMRAVESPRTEAQSLLPLNPIANSLMAQGGATRPTISSSPTQVAPGTLPTQPSTSGIKLSPELQTLQGVQRLEEKVAYLEALLKALNAKVDAVNTKTDALNQQHQQITSQLGAHPAQYRILPPNQRWETVLNGAAVLDRETGLVWERSPSPQKGRWINAPDICPQKQIGGRSGWRLPTIQELASLAPLSGSPFVNVLISSVIGVRSGLYFTSTVSRRPSTSTSGPLVGVVGFDPDHSSPGFQAAEFPGSDGEALAWCVRGSGGKGD
jgi:hypothetical protein